MKGWCVIKNKAFDKILGRLRSAVDKECVSSVQKVRLCDALSIVQEVAEEYKGGWIPCSERLPEDDKKQYIVQKTNGFIDILGFTKDAYKLDRYDFAEYKGKKKQLFYDYDSEYGYTEWECEAWQPLPEPYKESD